MPEIRIAEVVSRGDRRRFARVPWRVNAGRPGWVPPLLSEELGYLDPRIPARSYCDAIFALALDGDRTLGRIAGIINRRYNEKTGVRAARFGMLECVNDPEAARRLLGHVESWARSREMEKIVGPMGFTDQDPEGLLIEGFEQIPTLGSYTNPEYCPGLVEACGYAKEVDYVVYRVEVPAELPDFYRRILGRQAGRGVFRLVEFKRRREFRPYVEPILRLMGTALEGLYGFVAPDEREMRDLVRRYRPLLDPRFVKAVEKDGEVVGFIIGMPNLAPGLRAADGRLFPFGFIPVLWAGRHSRQLDLLVGGVRPDCRGRGVDILLGAAMLEEARRSGFRVIDSHHELEENRLMRAEMERMGGRIYKRYRVYSKRLAAPAPTEGERPGSRAEALAIG